MAPRLQVKEENDALREELGRLRIDHHRAQVGLPAGKIRAAQPTCMAGMPTAAGRSPLLSHRRRRLFKTSLPQVRYERVTAELQKLRGATGQVSRARTFDLQLPSAIPLVLHLRGRTLARIAPW